MASDRLADLRRLESEVRYSFRDKELLNHALSHRSYAHDNGKGSRASYERLEFLGDAVVGMVVSEELYKTHPELMEGKSQVTILADSFEALVGAMYLDGGLEAARRLLDRLLLTEKDAITADQILHSTKSNLLQLAQERYRTQPVYKVVKTTGPEHNKVFTCEVRVAGRWVARGVGSSKKEAEKVAAWNALKKLSARTDIDPALERVADADSTDPME